MQPFYLLRPDGSFSDSALYPAPPAAREDGEWVAGWPPAEAESYKPTRLADTLNAMFNALAPELQAELAPLKAAVKLELEQQRASIARLIIERAPIPEDLEPLRTAMLGEFDALS